MKLLNFLLIICCTLFAGKAIGAEDGKSFFKHIEKKSFAFIKSL